MTENQQTTPRAYTAEEIANKLIWNAIAMADYWAVLKGTTPQERTRGTVFSVLAMLDGSNIDIPAFDLVAVPHESDKAYHIAEGSNYHEPETRISLPLHELFTRIEKDYDEYQKAQHAKGSEHG